MDQGSEFEEEFQKLAEEFYIEMKVISSHHPQANGQVERTNRDILDSINCSSAEDWDVQSVLAVGRTGISPQEVMFGEPPRINRIISTEPESILDDSIIQDRWKSRRDLQVKVRQMLETYEASFQKGHTVKEGDLIWLRNFGRKNFEPRWVGPGTAVEAPRSHSVKIKKKMVCLGL